MSFKKYKDLWFGIIALAFSVFYLVVGSQIVTRPKLTPSYASAKVVPILLGSLLALLSVLLIIQAVRKLRAAAATGGAEAETGEKATRDDLLTVVLTLGVILLYIILLPALGFCLSSIIYLFAQMVIMAPKGKRQLREVRHHRGRVHDGRVLRLPRRPAAAAAARRHREPAGLLNYYK